MSPLFRTLVWSLFVLVILIELLYAQSRPHWFVIVLGFTILNGLAFACLRVFKPRVFARSSSSENQI